MNHKLKLMVAVVLVLTVSACSSIINGTTQSVGMSSTPSGATVSVNGQILGKTPIIVDLKRKDQHIVRIELPGYQPYETTLTRKTSGWVWGNLAFGGIIGLVIDAISGGMYKLTPEQVQATMLNSAKLDVKNDNFYLVTVLEPDPSWEKIGQLEKK